MVGEKEEAEGTVNVRTRDNVVHGMHPLEAVEKVLVDEKLSRSLTSIFGHDSSAANGSEARSENGTAEQEPELAAAQQ